MSTRTFFLIVYRCFEAIVRKTTSRRVGAAPQLCPCVLRRRAVPTLQK